MPVRQWSEAQEVLLERTINARSNKDSGPVSMKPWGVPGEEHQLWVVPLKAGQKPPERLVGLSGNYRVQLLLSRPGYPIAAESQHNFIDNTIGDSHIAITKPLEERKPEDCVEVLLQASGRGKMIHFTGLPNDNGYLGKLIVKELFACNFHDADTQAYEALAPFLSAWSLHLDIPVHVETIQVTELQTQLNSLRVRTPNFEMTFAGGVSPMLTDDFCQYASLYREGMNTNSGFYRFLCFSARLKPCPSTTVPISCPNPRVFPQAVKSCPSQNTQ